MTLEETQAWIEAELNKQLRELLLDKSPVSYSSAGPSEGLVREEIEKAVANDMENTELPCDCEPKDDDIDTQDAFIKGFEAGMNNRLGSNVIYLNPFDGKSATLSHYWIMGYHQGLDK